MTSLAQFDIEKNIEKYRIEKQAPPVPTNSHEPVFLAWQQEMRKQESVCQAKNRQRILASSLKRKNKK